MAFCVVAGIALCAAGEGFGGEEAVVLGGEGLGGVTGGGVGGGGGEGVGGCEAGVGGGGEGVRGGGFGYGVGGGGVVMREGERVDRGERVTRGSGGGFDEGGGGGGVEMFLGGCKVGEGGGVVFGEVVGEGGVRVAFNVEEGEGGAARDGVDWVTVGLGEGGGGEGEVREGEFSAGFEEMKVGGRVSGTAPFLKEG